MWLKKEIVKTDRQFWFNSELFLKWRCKIQIHDLCSLQLLGSVPFLLAYGRFIYLDHGWSNYSSLPLQWSLKDQHDFFRQHKLNFSVNHLNILQLKVISTLVCFHRVNFYLISKLESVIGLQAVGMPECGLLELRDGQEPMHLFFCTLPWIQLQCIYFYQCTLLPHEITWTPVWSLNPALAFCLKINFPAMFKLVKMYWFHQLAS